MQPTRGVPCVKIKCPSQPVREEFRLCSRFTLQPNQGKKFLRPIKQPLSHCFPHQPNRALRGQATVTIQPMAGERGTSPHPLCIHVSQSEEGFREAGVYRFPPPLHTNWNASYVLHSNRILSESQNKSRERESARYGIKQWPGWWFLQMWIRNTKHYLCSI